MKKFLFAALSLLTASLSLAAVNINTASPSELEALPGIGPAKAKAIVDYRQQHGAFKSVEELKNVKGIGEGIFSKLKAEATVAPAAQNKTATPAAKKINPSAFSRIGKVRRCKPGDEKAVRIQSGVGRPSCRAGKAAMPVPLHSAVRSGYICGKVV